MFFISITTNAQVNTVKSKIEEDKISFFDDVKANFSYSFGQTSNVAKLSKDEAGAYNLIKPTLSLEGSSSDSFSYNMDFGAELKKYTEQAAEALGNESSIDARVSSIWFLNDSWELGGDVGAYRVKNKLPVQLSSTETTSQDQEYFEPDARLYLSWIGENLTVEGGASASYRDYKTTLIDRGNVFYNDYEQYGVDVKVGREFDEQFSLYTKAVINRRQYKERPADFTDGAPSLVASPLPQLEEVSSEISIVAEYKLGKVKLTTTPSIKLSDDKVFGARDSETIKIQQKFSIPITAKVVWAPSFIFSNEKFSQFRSDPENLPSTSPLREDSETKIASSLSYTFKKDIVGNIDYGFTNKKSNYAGSSYEEQTIAAGIAISM